MNCNDNSSIEVKGRNLITLGTLGSWAIRLVAIFICLFPTSTAFAQSTYSDEWVDDSDPNNVKIVASGASYDASNGYMGTPQGYQQIHHYWVKVTITSPTGRTATINSSWSSSYAITEASLPLLVGGEYETGNYFTQTQHWNCCPYMQPNPWDGTKCYPGTTTSTTTPISLKNSGWRVVSEGLTTCSIVATCSGTCVSIGETHELIKDPPGISCSAGGIYVQVKELYVAGVCFHVTRFGFNQPFPGSCD